MVKKDLKINIKNTQIAQAINLGKVKEKLAAKKADTKEEEEVKISKASSVKKKEAAKQPAQEKPKKAAESEVLEEVPKRKARSKSVFAETPEQIEEPAPLPEKTVVKDEAVPEVEEPIKVLEASVEKSQRPEKAPSEPKKEPVPAPPKKTDQLGPTGRHINDILPPKAPPKKVEKKEHKKAEQQQPRPQQVEKESGSSSKKVPGKATRFREYKDVNPNRKQQMGKFDARDRQGLRTSDEDSRWRKKRSHKQQLGPSEDMTIRPSKLTIRLPITIKDLAQEMKLKASQLIQKLFLQGVAVTINDVLDDETTVQLLGEEFDCTITVDTSEEERIRITDKTIKEEIAESAPEDLETRAPVVTFMGHVDHGKTSIIDYIRNSNIATSEAGAITQHVGAFLCQTKVGNIAILDTPGHEAFSAMRARGADVTDIVVLVIAGDEGMRAQTEEAINHAKAAGVSIVVAINKCDKPNFDQEKVYRQLADRELLPESWGGSTITVNCSAVTGEGINELLEMLALQAEVLELKANPKKRARGTVIESELHKGMGACATILVQNGTLKLGDALVFGENYGRVKTMRNELGKQLQTASPSTPVEITGLSGIPEAGDEFIVVSEEKEARQIAEARQLDKRQLYLQQTKAASLDNLFQEASDRTKKILRVILRADVQGSMEALKTALLKIDSDKAEIDIIATGVGEISESDVLLAAASNAIIIGFHTQVESHADPLLKQHGIHVFLHDIIYHAVDEVKNLMAGLLDKVAEEVEKGKAEIRAVFKASQLGKIAGCLVIEGTIHRNHHMRVVRNGEVIWKGGISSIKRVQDDVREVQKGLECGIVINGNLDIEVGDILEAYEIIYITQEL
ncbi:translation initiation factor IF-2 [Waddlia chondrophila]|uniref:Translation initiation factor IF-2 n=1 Tax=Waddlia chondrophila (strain ATCC VR-1470 / WSU 86-1044) TaxID=716544 RepID=D6YVR3_WADCW|nr:translation initiation factor IF-2 [Waddlia chondrophila]ADI38224.1 Translation initiation factor IF-2 [Waddlia chondrophila WSU 86-1044]